VFFLADDLGWNDVSYHGSEIPTPNIDALAASGARLEALYASPTCTPTRASLMTGRYPMRLGLQSGVLRPHSRYGLPLGERTLAELLQSAGYETAICGKWHLGFFEAAYRPTERGFEHQYGNYNGAVDYLSKTRQGGIDWQRDDVPLVVREGAVARLAPGEEGYATDLIAREAVHVIENRDPDRPLFLYVPFTAPHAPLRAPSEDIARLSRIEDPNRRLYAAVVHRMDARIGTVLEALERKGMREDTLIVFASDNGGDTQFGSSNAPFSDGKRGIGEGGLRVPGVVVWPGRIQPRAIPSPVSFVDWLPTFAKLAGVDVKATETDGVDLSSILEEGGELERTTLLLHLEPDRGSARSGAWKLVVHGDLLAEGAPFRATLFDLDRDPAETTDRSADQAGLVQTLTERLRGWSREAAPALGWPNDPPPAGYSAPDVWADR
jgi:arylsulfatase A-like enzyme